MKNHVKGILCLIAVFSCINSWAQKKIPIREPDLNRPSQFSNLPERLICHMPELESLLQYVPGNTVNLTIADNLNFRGIVSSMASNGDAEKIQSVTIRSTNFPGSVLSFSKIRLLDGSVRYTGRLISFQHADAYEMNLDNEQYVFIKKGFYDLVNE